MKQLRAEQGKTLRDLAKFAAQSKSHLHNFESGRHLPSIKVARLIDDALDARGELVELHASDVVDPHDAAADNPEVAASPLTENLRTALITRRGGSERFQDLATIEGEVLGAHDAYQRSAYAAAAAPLPDAIAGAQQAVQGASGDIQRQAHRVLALSNAAASKLAAKAGDGTLAWVTADRAVSSALIADDRGLSGMANYQVALALTNLPRRLGDAQDVVENATGDLRAAGLSSLAELSICGSLLLLGAIVAARQGDPRTVHDRFRDAARVAETVDQDRNDVWSGSGRPTC